MLRRCSWNQQRTPPSKMAYCTRCSRDLQFNLMLNLVLIAPPGSFGFRRAEPLINGVGLLVCGSKEIPLASQPFRTSFACTFASLTSSSCQNCLYSSQGVQTLHAVPGKLYTRHPTNCQDSWSKPGALNHESPACMLAPLTGLLRAQEHGTYIGKGSGQRELQHSL